MILKVSALVYIPHLPFGAIGPLGLNEAICTLEIQLQPHWLVLDMLLGVGLTLKILTNDSLVLVALPARGDHNVSLLIMTGCLLIFFDGFF